MKILAKILGRDFFSNWKPQTTVIKQRLTFFQSDQSKAQAYLCTPTKCLVGGNYGTVNSGRLPYYSFITQNRRKNSFWGTSLAYPLVFSKDFYTKQRRRFLSLDPVSRSFNFKQFKNWKFVYKRKRVWVFQKRKKNIKSNFPSDLSKNIQVYHTNYQQT